MRKCPISLCSHQNNTWIFRFQTTIKRISLSILISIVTKVKLTYFHQPCPRIPDLKTLPAKFMSKATLNPAPHIQSTLGNSSCVKICQPTVMNYYPYGIRYPYRLNSYIFRLAIHISRIYVGNTRFSMIPSIPSPGWRHLATPALNEETLNTLVSDEEKSPKVPK